jgi:hypothetical protein
MPGAGAAPSSTGTQYNKTAGGLFFPDQASFQRYIAGFSGLATTQGTLILFDRLCSVGAVSLAATGAKSLNNTVPTRYTDGIGLEAFIEITTATTTTAPVVRLDYTDDTNAAVTTAPTLTLPNAATPLNWMGPLPLLTGSLGIKQLTNLQVNTAAAAGVANVTLCKRLAEIGIIANTKGQYDLVSEPPPRIYDGATLMFAWYPSTTTATSAQGKVGSIYA